MNGRSAGILLAFVAMASMTWPPSPAAANVVHESCDLTNDGTSLVGSKAYAESFTAGQAGKLTSGFIEAFNNLDAAETYTVELWDADAFGLPTGTAPLASTTVALPAEHGFHTAAATFATPPKLSKGQNYALVVTVPDAANNGVTVDPNNPCPGTFATSATGALGAFQPDPNNRDMVMAASIKVKRRHHRH